MLLRLAIGWHFFKEGMSHHVDKTWSSEGFLRQAKGPLADAYHSVLPDLHGWNRLMLAPLSDKSPADATDNAAEAKEPAATKEAAPKEEAAPKDAAEPKAANAAKAKLAVVAVADHGVADGATEKSPDKKTAAKKGGESADKTAADEGKVTAGKTSDAASAAKKAASSSSAIYDAWLKSAVSDWKADITKDAEAYHFTDDQKSKADAILADTKRRMKDDLEDYEPDMRMYRELVARAQAMPLAPGGEVIPNEVARSAAAQQNPLGERGLNGQSSPLATTPAAWQSDAQAVDQYFHDQLRGLLTPEQREMAAPPSAASRLHDIDLAIGWTLMIVGGLLIVGLFTRVAAVVGALFLLSIIFAQPPWLATSVQTYTYNQTVEMLALLALATTPVGRWGGLDYFLGLCCSGCCRSRAKTVVEPPKATLPPGVNMPPNMKKRLS
ncbi:MAG TPA: DoxX family protein [Pirellulales bacterium]|nr:DoxX family protein [Pirellulales bacterium]